MHLSLLNDEESSEPVSGAMKTYVRALYAGSLSNGSNECSDEYDDIG